MCEYSFQIIDGSSNNYCFLNHLSSVARRCFLEVDVDRTAAVAMTVDELSQQTSMLGIVQ